MKTISFLLLTSHLAFGIGGLSLTVGVPHSGNTRPINAIYGLSYFLPSERLPGFHEIGLVAQPFGSLQNSELRLRPTWESWGALVTGHMFLWSPWFRPGFHLGPMYGTSVSLIEGSPNYEDHFSMYYAFNLQVLFLTAYASNIGFGGGINLSL